MKTTRRVKWEPSNEEGRDGRLLYGNYHAWCRMDKTSAHDIFGIDPNKSDPTEIELTSRIIEQPIMREFVLKRMANDRYDLLTAGGDIVVRDPVLDPYGLTQESIAIGESRQVRVEVLPKEQSKPLLIERVEYRHDRWRSNADTAIGDLLVGHMMAGKRYRIELTEV